MKELVERLVKGDRLNASELGQLLRCAAQDLAVLQLLRDNAVRTARQQFGLGIYIRGLIELSSFCRCNCLYCGLRRSNRTAERYRLTPEEVLECCKEGYKLGFRTFVLQGGEGVFSIDFVCDIVRKIKEKYPDCAVTLSLGEYQKADFLKMKNAGADRYLLRHETICKEHYKKLHPEKMSYENRLRCLKSLKELGFQVGCGFLVGSPHQTPEIIAKEFKFIEDFSPEMCGIGPFIPQKDTPFKNENAGTAEETAYYLSIIRLIKPNILLPATTALGTIKEGGRELGILSGANVVMPNLSPLKERSKYALYDNKLATGVESAEQIENLKNQMQKIGYEIVCDRGDINL